MREMSKLVEFWVHGRLVNLVVRFAESDFATVPTHFVVRWMGLATFRHKIPPLRRNKSSIRPSKPL